MIRFLLPIILVATPALGAVASDRDVHSHADISQFRQEHLTLDLDIDFARKQLSGTATLTLRELDGAGRQLVLDSRELIVRSVAIASEESSERLTFNLGEDDPVLGRPLIVYLPEQIPNPFRIEILYETSPDASGLQWLTPRQTAGGKQPFLFSQSQAIHARSWVPLQDTPAARFTYDATLRTEPELLAVMSAVNRTERAPDGTYTFSMEQPIPAYLLAIAVGNLEFAAIGERTGIYAEPELLARSLAEFEDTERMLEVGEELFGPYRWGRYDLLILPPSFPFGGMENPRLSFITPTVLAGDKSLVGLIAHELAHSWSGNLVTNATMRDFWLNEGFTVFLESRITEALYGERRRVMDDRLGYEDLLEDFAALDAPLELLAVDLEGMDPDIAFSNVPYEKGRLMLVWLDASFGRETMNRFLRQYFDHFAFQSITTDTFLAYLEQNLLQTQPGKVRLDEVRKWIFEPGLPASALLPPADVFAEIDEARSNWLGGKLHAKDIETAEWSTQDWLYFLNNLPKLLSKRQLRGLDKAFGLTTAGNNEIAHSWLRIAIRNDYREAWPRLESYLLSIGRNKLVKPLYTELMKTRGGAEFARDVFERAKPGYHPLTVAVNSVILYPDATP